MLKKGIYTMKDVHMIYENCKQKLDDLSIRTGVIKCVKVNSRAKKRWGRCIRVNSIYYDNMFEIEISSRLLEDNVSDKATETTMLHELIHTCPGCMNHGAEWKRIANRVNRAYGYNIKRITSEEEKGVESIDVKRIAKHKFVCEKCGKEVYRQRESNFTKCYWKYCCATCNGNFRKEY